MAKAARAPQRKVYEGQTFYSVQAAAEVLNRSVRTLRRLEQAGVIPRPHHDLPGGRDGQRWYSEADLAQLRELGAESGFDERRHGGRGRLQELLEALPGQARTEGRKSSWVGEEVSRRPLELLRRHDPNDVDPDEWIPPSERRQQPEQLRPDPLPAPELCPTCGVEVIWITEPKPGGVAIQLPACERHGVVDLSEPEVDPIRCPHCGQDLVWELLEADYEFQPVCSSGGPVQLPRPSRAALGEPEPFRHQVSFDLAPPERERPRGLQLGDLPGAVRAPRRETGTRITFADGYVGPTRPGR